MENNIVIFISMLYYKIQKSNKSVTAGKVTKKKFYVYYLFTMLPFWQRIVLKKFEIISTGNNNIISTSKKIIICNMEYANMECMDCVARFSPFALTVEILRFGHMKGTS